MYITMKILNKKQTKKLLQLVEKQFKTKINTDCYIKRYENKFYLISKDITRINLEELNIKSVGLYFGKIENQKFTPSAEAAHILNLPV